MSPRANTASSHSLKIVQSRAELWYLALLCISVIISELEHLSVFLSMLNIETRYVFNIFLHSVTTFYP